MKQYRPIPSQRAIVRQALARQLERKRLQALEDRIRHLEAVVFCRDRRGANHETNETTGALNESR